MYTSPISTLSATFKLPLERAELPAFRGAMSAFVGLENDLFHNHDNTGKIPGGYFQRYPLIQYRIARGKASVFGINQGAEALEEVLFASQLNKFRMNGKPRPLKLIRHDRDRSFHPEILPPGEFLSYRIKSYLPFSPDKAPDFKAILGLGAKISRLEQVLTNHIVAFGYGVGWPPPKEKRITVILKDLSQPYAVRLLNRKWMGFDLEFQANIRLPEEIGLGRSTAFGCGVTSFVYPKLAAPC